MTSLPMSCKRYGSETIVSKTKARSPESLKNTHRVKQKNKHWLVFRKSAFHEQVMANMHEITSLGPLLGVVGFY